VNGIEVGSNTNIQDNAVVHVAKHSISGKPAPTLIGSYVTIGHCATVHACTIGDNVLIGMGATVLDGAKVESGSIVAAGAVVPPKAVVPTGEVWAGSPAKFLRKLEPEEKEFITTSAINYSSLADVHRFENGKTFEELFVEAKIEVDRHLASDPINTIHQMWDLDAQTLLATKSKK
jgi:carbonic anhydrase/acetyltransferase-like protein (isoleucine patch superfamily)